jgi:hypothetical protein
MKEQVLVVINSARCLHSENACFQDALPEMQVLASCHVILQYLLPVWCLGSWNGRRILGGFFLEVGWSTTPRARFLFLSLSLHMLLARPSFGVLRLGQPPSSLGMLRLAQPPAPHIVRRGAFSVATQSRSPTSPPSSATPPSSVTVTPLEDRVFNLLLRTNERYTLGVTLRVAGGWVRDKLLGLPPKEQPDVDLAIDRVSGVEFATHVQRIMRDLQLQNQVGKLAFFRLNPEQSKHLETARLRVLGVEVDFAALRSDQYASDSRIPTIQTNVTAREDALRRDFTINSLYYNLHTKQVEDFTERGLAVLA